MDERRSSPTVIVSRTVRPEHADAFAAWVSRLVNAAHRHPGYVDSFVERPTVGHPSEWTVVYRFADRASLESWLSSPERLALLDEGEQLVEGPPREQIVAGPSSDREARVVSSYRLKPGTDARHAMVHQRMLDALAGFEGFIGREVLDAVPGVQDETVVILTFDTPEHLRAWIESETRAQVLDELDAITSGGLTTNVVGGFAGWFHAMPGGAEPKKWKQAAVVLLALFPVSLAVTVLRSLLLPDLQLVPSVFISNVIGVAVLTWLLMPPLTRALDGWLRR